MAAQTNMASSRCEAPSFGEAFPCLLFPFALFQSLELAVPLFSAFLPLPLIFSSILSFTRGRLLGFYPSSTLWICYPLFVYLLISKHQKY
jgi:hypothetical protein